MQKYGNKAACSYGPWQMMLCNFSEGTDPDDLIANPENAAADTVAFIKRELEHFSPNSLGAVGSMWNAGHPLTNPSPGVQKYMQQLSKNYNVPMPKVS